MYKEMNQILNYTNTTVIDYVLNINKYGSVFYGKEKIVIQESIFDLFF
jgi:hypothetical protein